jgi:hypothetical protein
VKRKIHTQLQILEILYFCTSISLILINALNYGICQMDSPFAKYEWLELVGQRQDGRILSSLDFFILGIFSPSDSKGWLEFHHKEGNKATSSKSLKLFSGRKGDNP